MSLIEFRKHAVPIADIVARILRAERGPYARITIQESKAWARKFVQDILPRWSPGEPMSEKEAQKVGKRLFALYNRKCPHDS